VHRITRELAEARLDSRRGVVVETTLDPHLQTIAERVVREHLAGLRRNHARLRDAPLSAALIAVDAGNGDVLAYVGGDPAQREDAFDRVRMAERQPGSTVKPIVLLEAFGSCGARDPLHPATRVADEPLSIDLPSGKWEPENYDGRYRGVIDVRTALAESRNVPLVRIARWCGWDETAKMFERAGLLLPADPPPSFALGAVETTPWRLARAYTVMANHGKAFEPLALRRIETPAGHALARLRTRERRVAPATVAYLVHDLMKSAVDQGTARVGRIDGLSVSAKTGSTQELRDAWFAGDAGSVVAVVWVGLDDGGSLGLPGSAVAGPIWKEFMTAAVPARPVSSVGVPRRIVKRYIDSRSGLLVRERNRKAKEEIFRPGALPPRDRFWRSDRAVPVVR
jgi:penicillin-binding protein 1B